MESDAFPLPSVHPLPPPPSAAVLETHPDLREGAAMMQQHQLEQWLSAGGGVGGMLRPTILLTGGHRWLTT
jgi:hypothetical protein